MQRAWHSDPAMRPAFDMLRKDLESMEPGLIVASAQVSKFSKHSTKPKRVSQRKVSDFSSQSRQSLVRSLPTSHISPSLLVETKGTESSGSAVKTRGSLNSLSFTSIIRDEAAIHPSTSSGKSGKAWLRPQDSLHQPLL